MSGAFSSKYQRIQNVSANYTVDPADDAVVGTAATAFTITLYNPLGKYFKASPPGGRIMVVNSSTSAFPITIAAAAGSIIGPAVISPGQTVTYTSDGSSNWYSDSGSNGGAAGSLLTTQVPVTAANIFAMYAAPVAQLPAPGANKVIVMDTIITQWALTATQFANGGAVIYQYDNTVHGAGVNTCTATVAAAVVNAAAAATSILTGTGAVAGASTAVVNKGVFISNATGAFDTGTGTGLTTFVYRIVTVA
jgi:hypothetical protein